MQEKEITLKYEMSIEAMKAYASHLELTNQLMDRELERIDYYQSETEKSLKKIKRLRIIFNLTLAIVVPVTLIITVGSIQQCLS